MRRCWPALALALAAGAECAAQSLDLDGTDAPMLGLDTYAGLCIRVLQQEMAALAARAAVAEPDLRRRLQVSFELRSLTARLLDAGDRAGPQGSPAVVAGARLFGGRDLVDDAIRAADDGPAAPAAREALARFCERVTEIPADLDAAAAIDGRLVEWLAPLAEAVEAADADRPACHWPVLATVGASPAPGPAPGPADVSLRLERLALDDETLEALDEVLDYLRRGAAYAEFQPTVRRLSALLLGGIEFLESARATAWLDAGGAASAETLLARALALVAERRTRDEGELLLGALARADALLARLRQLAAAPRRGGPRPDLEPVQASFAAALAGAAGGRDLREIATLDSIVDAMIAFGDLSEPPLGRDLRLVWRRLDDSYRATERELLLKLPEMVPARLALSDPAWASLVTDQLQYIEDLHRLARADTWVESVRRIAPGAAGPFGGTLRRQTADLVDPARRPAAIEMLDRFERELAWYEAMPFEASLRRGEPAAIAATAGRQAELADAIDRARVEWAAGWGRGDPDDVRMRLMRRLVETMAETSCVLDGACDPVVLNRWAAWELSEATAGRYVTDLTNRLKLATVAAVEGDDDELARQLDRAQPRLPALMAAIWATLAADLASLPGGAGSIVGQSVRPPPPGAWMAGRRQTLADLCRYAMELDYARRTGRRDLAEKLRAYVDTLATSLIQEAAP